MFVSFFFLRLNPTAALDFVWTCFHSPRLWQGRDQKSTAVGSQGTNSVRLCTFFCTCICVERIYEKVVWLQMQINSCVTLLSLQVHR